MKKKVPFVGQLFIVLLFSGICAQNIQAQLSPDSLGNRIPDFSYCGYKASEIPIPNVSIQVVVPPSGNDATGWIQEAIDQVARLPVDENGFRGAVLLQAGDYKVSGNLKISASGIVLRGSGAGEGGTRLIAAGKDRRTLIRIEGTNNRQAVGDTLRVAGEYVPVGAMELTLAGNHRLKVGGRIMIVRPSTKEWIQALGTSHFGGGITSLGWKPDEHSIYWDRTVVSVNGDRIVFDAPITTALDQQYGGGYVIPYTWTGRITDLGIENMQCVSEYNSRNPKDEAHAWMAITISNAADVWVRNMTFKHFAGSAVFVLETAKRITVENCKYLSPVSEIGGQRRNAFLTMGQQCLFQRLYSEYGYHDFALGYCAPGPNAFVECYAYLPYSFSGPVDAWASGVLFDIVNIDGGALRYANLSQDNQGAGWNAANSVFWQCSPSRMECFAPPTAMNWAFGAWSEFSGDGYWENTNNHVHPRSLFYAQLEKRLGKNYVDRSNLIQITTNPTSSPTIEQAQKLTQIAREPAIPLYDWIDWVIAQSPIPTDAGKAKMLTAAEVDARLNANTTSNLNVGVQVGQLTIENGRLVRNHQIQTGGKHDINYWNGNLRPSFLNYVARPHITRFVPGRTGTGLTDDIDSVVQWMKQRNIIALDHHYGLWYERRRDDHERIRRIDGNVWAPFYEQAFARSGQGRAYDGLSKYDLTRYNDWYWMRLKQFADAADENGLVLLHQNYFQHNIIEAGAHWADSPWRPENNINNTGFPEPTPYAGDKRIFMAEHFYDVTHPVRRELHRAYIRQCLENFKDNHSVIQLISEEFTGPLHFVAFWLDVIAEWEKETGRHPLIALSTTKDVQDAILADPVRSKTVDIIDIRYWHYRADGTLYVPAGGLNLAPRQHARLTAPGRVSFESVYRAVSEYRTKYPEKAVLYYAEGYQQYGQAVLDAGGSLASGRLAETEVYLYTSFHEPADEGLRFLYSYDGFHWDSIPGVFLKPEVGRQKVMRDPSMVQGPDGTFHLVWTCSWNQDPGFGYASSNDLIHWSEQKHIPVMAHDTSVVNVWAPELFYEDCTGEFYIVWASTIPFKFKKGMEEERNNHRLYYTKTKDFIDFTPAELLYDPGFSSIDAVIVKRAPSDYVLVFKDNTRPERNILAAFGKTPAGPYGNMTARFTEMFTEGPSVVKVGNEWLIYFDAYRNKTYEAVATQDFKHFTQIQDKIKVPAEHKHGTIVKVPERVLNGIPGRRTMVSTRCIRCP